jgi:hypothetical protein
MTGDGITVGNLTGNDNNIAKNISLCQVTNVIFSPSVIF